MNPSSSSSSSSYSPSSAHYGAPSHGIDINDQQQNHGQQIDNDEQPDRAPGIFAYSYAVVKKGEHLLETARNLTTLGYFEFISNLYYIGKVIGTYIVIFNDYLKVTDGLWNEVDGYVKGMTIKVDGLISDIEQIKGSCDQGSNNINDEFERHRSRLQEHEERLNAVQRWIEARVSVSDPSSRAPNDPNMMNIGFEEKQQNGNQQQS